MMDRNEITGRNESGMRKGEFTFMTAMMILGIFVLFALLYTITTKISSGNEVVGTMSDENVRLCQQQETRKLSDPYSTGENRAIDMSKYDTDNDGILDACDTCVVSKELVCGKRGPNLKGYIISNNCESEGVSKNLGADNQPNDKDRDGIINGCDSDSNSKASKWLGFIQNPQKTECRKVAAALGKSPSEANAAIVEDYGYVMCHIS